MARTASLPGDYRRSLMGRNADLRRPREYVQPGARWPEGPLEADAPREARLAQGIASKLEQRGARGEVNKIAQRCGLTRQTIYNVLDGNTWPDLVTIARLEVHFGVRLWGNQHRRKPQGLADRLPEASPPTA